MPFFAEALDNRAKKTKNKTCWSKLHHTQEGSMLMNYRVIPPTVPCLLNLTASLKSVVDKFDRTETEEDKNKQHNEKKALILKDS